MQVRYGWPLGDFTCCPHQDEVEGLSPCYPAACPIKARDSGLPANPFYANIVNGKCECMAPQTCDQ